MAVSRIFGTVLPYVRRVIFPCDAFGVPAMDDEEVAASHFETRAVVAAWFGFCWMFPYGDVGPRAVDPANPRQYLAGNL
jgi:hypothetical protein